MSIIVDKLINMSSNKSSSNSHFENVLKNNLGIKELLNSVSFKNNEIINENNTEFYTNATDSNQFPQKLLKESSINNLIEFVYLNLNNNDTNHPLFEANLIRALLLFSNLEKANNKIEELIKNNKRQEAIDRLNKNVYKSQLQAVSDIIITNNEIIYIHYIIEWILSFNNKIDKLESNIHSIRNNPGFLKNFIKNFNKSKIVPDEIFNSFYCKNRKNANSCNDSYNESLQLIYNFILNNNCDLDKASEFSTSIGLLNISCMLSCGLPSYNYNTESKLNIDYDLLPIFCRTKELKALKNNDIDFSNTKIIGNNNWIIRLLSFYKTVDNNNSKLKENNEKLPSSLIKIHSLISGNSNNSCNYVKDGIQAHESLLFSLNSIYVLKILENYSKIKIINLYHSLDDSKIINNFINLLNNKNNNNCFKSLIELINYYKRNENDNMSNNRIGRDFMFNLELDIIKIYMFKDTCTNNKLNKFEDLFSSFCKTFNDMLYYMSNISNEPTFKNQNKAYINNIYNSSKSSVSNNYYNTICLNEIKYYYNRNFFIINLLSYNFFSDILNYIYSELDYRHKFVKNNNNNKSRFSSIYPIKNHNKNSYIYFKVDDDVDMLSNNSYINKTIKDLQIYEDNIDNIFSLYDSVNLNYFNCLKLLSNFTNCSQIKLNKSIEDVFNNNNQIIKNINPEDLIYILSYCLKPSNIESSLITLVDQIQNIHYNNFSNEIKENFSEKINENLRLKLANNISTIFSDNYKQDNDNNYKYTDYKENAISLDKSLIRSIKDISLEDKDVFDKIKSILNSLNNINSINDKLVNQKEQLKIIIKKCVYYLINNKNLEVSLFLNTYSNITSMYNSDIPLLNNNKEFEINLMNESAFTNNLSDEFIHYYKTILCYFEENAKSSAYSSLEYYDNYVLYYLLLLIKLIQNSFESFRMLKNIDFDNIQNENNIIANCIKYNIENFKLTYRAIILFVNDANIQSYSKEFLGENNSKFNENYKYVVDELNNVLSNWAYHLILWSGWIYKTFLNTKYFTE